MPPLPAPATPAESVRQRAWLDAIVAYLATNPMAADSVDGIARWWLGQDAGGQTARGDVERAVATLVARGVLREVRLPDGSLIYQGANDAPAQ